MKITVNNRCLASSQGTIEAVYMDGCSQTPCEIHRGDTAHGGFIFTAAAATDTLTCQIFATIFGTEVRSHWPDFCRSRR